MRQYYSKPYIQKTAVADVNPPQPVVENTWGPHFWETLHIISFNYPDNPTNAQKQAAWNFFNSLSFLLPCPVCCNHCSDYISSNPPLVYNKQFLTKWVSDLHNSVNLRLGKPTWTFSQVQQKYGNLNTSCPLS